MLIVYSEVNFSNGCEAPDFNQERAISLFLKPEWAARLDLFFDLVSQTPPTVQHCMTDYFKVHLNISYRRSRKGIF